MFDKTRLNDEISNKNRDLEKMNLRLQDNMNNHEVEKNKLNGEIDSLFKTTKKNEKDLTEAHHKILVKEKEMKNLENKITGLERSLSQSKKLNEDTVKEFEKVKLNFEANIHAKSDRIKEFEQQNEELLQNLKKIT